MSRCFICFISFYASLGFAFGYGFEPESEMLWPNGVIPYVLEDDVTEDQRKHLLAGMSIWELATPVSFVPRTNEKNFVRFTVVNKLVTGTEEVVGQAHVGMDGGRQSVRVVSRECLGVSHTILHEIGHAIGLKHEHQRPDAKVDVIHGTDTSIDDALQQITLHGRHRLRYYGSYDPASVMHYSVGPSDNGTSYLQYRKGFKPVASRNRLSEGDIAAVWEMYGRRGSERTYRILFSIVEFYSEARVAPSYSSSRGRFFGTDEEDPEKEPLLKSTLELARAVKSVPDGHYPYDKLLRILGAFAELKSAKMRFDEKYALRLELIQLQKAVRDLIIECSQGLARRYRRLLFFQNTSWPYRIEVPLPPLKTREGKEEAVLTKIEQFTQEFTSALNYANALQRDYKSAGVIDQDTFEKNAESYDEWIRPLNVQLEKINSILTNERKSAQKKLRDLKEINWSVFSTSVETGD